MQSELQRHGQKQFKPVYKPRIWEKGGNNRLLVNKYFEFLAHLAVVFGNYLLNVPHKITFLNELAKKMLFKLSTYKMRHEVCFRALHRFANNRNNEGRG